MALAADIRNFSNLARGLRSFLRTRVTRADAAAALRRRLDERETNFVGTVASAIFDNPSSPYRPLLAMAGCELGDLSQMIRTRGLEPTLRSLRESGVYFTFEEYKGRQPVERGGRLVAVSPAQFKNPGVPHHFWSESGGSTGPGSRVSASLTRPASTAGYLAIAHDAYGVARAPKAQWRGLLPASAGINYVLACAATGEILDRWFTPLVPADLTSSRKYPLATYSILSLARAFGTKLPWPEPVDLENAQVIARWAAAATRTHGRCHLSTTASMALRVCLAARTEGLDLAGVVFSGGGEPMTAAKAAGISAVGAACRPAYFCAEAGAVGMSCANPVDANDQHLLEDAVAVIQYPRDVPGAGVSVDAFNVTSLLPTATHVLLNVELDDYGLIETRACGCAFEALGLRRHVRHIRSFRKYTGEGVSLIGSDMARVLEEVLPSRFGGSPLDYQLSENEDAAGFTRLTLVISPRVPITSEAAVLDAVWTSLASSGAGADHARATWEKAGTLRITRAEPEWTARGKFPPLRRRVQP